MENETIEIPPPEPTDTEVLVDKSGVRMWHPRTWRDSIRDNKKIATIALLGALVFAGTFTMSITSTLSNQRLEKKLETTQKDLRESKSDTKDVQTELNDANGTITLCQAKLEIAWKAWDRRNMLMVTVLNNIFGSGDTTAITNDNTLAAYDFVDSKDCNPFMDSDEIFVSQTG